MPALKRAAPTVPSPACGAAARLLLAPFSASRGSRQEGWCVPVGQREPARLSGQRALPGALPQLRHKPPPWSRLWECCFPVFSLKCYAPDKFRHDAWDLNTSLLRLLLLVSSSNTWWVTWARCVCSHTRLSHGKARSHMRIRCFAYRRYSGSHSQVPCRWQSEGKPNSLPESSFIRKRICFPLLGTHWREKGKLQPAMLASPPVKRLNWWHFSGSRNSCGAFSISAEVASSPGAEVC